MNHVAVAAWSMITPLGVDEETLDALFASKSGFTYLPSEFELRNNLAGVITNPPRVTGSYAQQQRHLALLVGERAVSNAEVDLADEKVAFVFATSYGHLLDDPGTETMSTWATDCVRSLGSSAKPIVVGTACSAGADAVGIASALLQDDQCDTVVVIAVDIVTEAKRLAHSRLGTMTDSLPKPFDINRNGMLLGEAAAAVILRRSSDCVENHGELIGYGASNDAAGLTAPDLSGVSVRLAIQRAFLAANIGPSDVSVYLAHGTATHLNDEVESKVVEDIFVENKYLKLFGVKGALGHSLGACGLVEFIVLLQVLKKGYVPAIVGLSNPLELVQAKTPKGYPAASNTKIGISVKLGFGGFNTALIAKVG